MSVAKKPVKKSVPKTTPTRAQLEDATRKSAIARTKAQNAKAALKNAKKTFKLARKAAKAARKKADALQEAIARAEEAGPPARLRRREMASELESGGRSRRSAPRAPLPLELFGPGADPWSIHRTLDLTKSAIATH